MKIFSYSEHFQSVNILLFKQAGFHQDIKINSKIYGFNLFVNSIIKA